MAGPPRSGWPWRPTAGAPAERRRQTLERLQRPDGPLFAYLADEVVSRASEATRDLIARAVHFDRFSAPMCVAIGSPDAEAILARMARRALFLQSHPAGDGWYALHGLVREFTLARLPLPRREMRAVQARAADWFEAQGLLEAALDARLLADDPAALAASCRTHAPTLVLGGATRKVIDATALVPLADRTARLERATGEAFLVRGEWREAYASFDRAAGKRGHLDAATAWRMGLIHGLRGAYDEALAIYSQAVVDGSQPADEAMLDAWIASAHYHRGDVAASREAAERALAPGAGSR